MHGSMKQSRETVCSKLIQIFRHDDGIHKEALMHNIKLFCSDKLWAGMVGLEMRKNLRHARECLRDGQGYTFIKIESALDFQNVL